MSPADRSLIEDIAKGLEAASEGRAAGAVVLTGEVSAEVRALAEAANRVTANFGVLRQFSVALANGRINFDAPPQLHLLDPLKSLQASLKHLTWQAQEVAAGHLEHQVDFLGEFSTAFNQMTGGLREKRRAEHEAMHAARLATVGQLAAGMAHELNTPIQYLGDNLGFLSDSFKTIMLAIERGQVLESLRPDDPALPKARAGFQHALESADLPFLRQEVPAAIQQSVDGLQRIASIVQCMKDFAQPEMVAKTEINVNEALENVLAVSRKAWSSVAEIEKDFDPSLPAVVCHASDVKQVFLNLIMNAAQAIEESGKPRPGCISLATRRDGDSAVIRVSDTGLGVPTAIRDRIFDPFFTARLVGKGIGLGLAICRDIVNKHGGTIEVAGQPDEGADFLVLLPIRTL